MNKKINSILLCCGLIFFIFQSSIQAQDSKQIEGRWDLTMEIDGEKLPSWLEIRHSGFETLVGRFVYVHGSARPISEIKFEKGEFSFNIPPQWEKGKTNIFFTGKVEDKGLVGTMKYVDGKTYHWKGNRVPNLPYTKNATWSHPIDLFNGKNLDGWNAVGKNQWIVESGILKSTKQGANLVSNDKFTDFKLHVEFRYPKGSNSGIYLRGRYEVQITDSKGLEPSDIQFGGVYGFLTPNEMVAKEAGEWQTYDITLIGRRVTIIANGKPIIVDQIIPGITGGAIDSSEGEAGPFLIQGDHGPIEFKSFVVEKLKVNK